MQLFVWELRADRVSSWRFWRAEQGARIGLALQLLAIALVALLAVAVVAGAAIALL